MREWKIKKSNVSNLIATLLEDRGINKDEEEVFLHPDYERDTHDPFLFADMEKAVARLKLAIDSNEKVIIFGDYDADGTGGTVIFTDFFQKIKFENFAVYIPDRFHEGYGLKMKHVEDFIKGGAKLIITIDCGVTNYDEIAHAEREGTNVIVLDHHIVPPKWPPAHAIINPKKEDEPYPYKFICGTGLAFKMVDAMLKKYDFAVPKNWQRWLLDVVAISTVADMVPLTGENRVLLQYGLKVLRKSKRKGLSALYNMTRTNAVHIDEMDIGFTIAPRINAASRLAHATISHGLLTVTNDEEAKRLALQLEEINSKRKKLVEEIYEEAVRQVKDDSKQEHIIFLGNESWPPGVLGIVCNRLVSEFSRPAYLWGGGGENYKGSCRTYGGLNVVDLMREAGESILTDFGGHKASGGFAVEKKDIHEFSSCIREVYESGKHASAEDPLLIEAVLAVDDVSESLFSAIHQLAPFGMENPKPLFCFRHIKPIGAGAFGSNGGGHVKVTFRREDGTLINAIGFGTGTEWIERIQSGERIDMAAAIEENRWNGKREIRLRIEALRPSVEIPKTELAKELISAEA